MTNLEKETSLSKELYTTRADVASAKRIVIKCGTSTVCNPSGDPALSRLANIVESIVELKRRGKEVILVSSGAVGLGKHVLRRHALYNTSLGDIVARSMSERLVHDSVSKSDPRAKEYQSSCAAAGQMALVRMYDNFFEHYDMATSQFLVTPGDFEKPDQRQNLKKSMDTLLRLGVIPIINENDAITDSLGDASTSAFSDNDSLAALVASQLDCQLLVLLTDVDGIFDRPPTVPGAKLIHTFDTPAALKRHAEGRKAAGVEVGEKSAQGRGGMEAKIDAALKAVRFGVRSVVIAKGDERDILNSVIDGLVKGTLITANPDPQDLLADGVGQHAAVAARHASRKLQALTTQQRQRILECLAWDLLERADEILEANARDLIAAQRNGIDPYLVARLKLSRDQLSTLSAGVQTLAALDEPLGKELDAYELADGSTMRQVTVPVGVVLVIFESRPETLPQIAALALRSGNGLLLKGDGEAEESNAVFHRIVQDAIVKGSGGTVDPAIVGLVGGGREGVTELLKLDKEVDLVIPRGSNAMVKKVKGSTRIPVLGHADGVCHVFIDAHANPAKAMRVVIDSRSDYPGACNACETVLLHRATLEATDGAPSLATATLRALFDAGIDVLGGPEAIRLGITAPVQAQHAKLTVAVEVVDDVDAAIEHINKQGSGHTDCIVTESGANAERFLAGVDSACAFHNAATRFVDGYRLGVGQEAGASSGTINARGPVGVEGLLTTKWMMRSAPTDADNTAQPAGTAKVSPPVATGRQLSAQAVRSVITSRL